MSVKKYDVIFSLGSACLCSQTLRKLHLQFCSYPLDWVIGGDFPDRTDLLVSNFKDYFIQEDFVLSTTWQEEKTDVYDNKRTGITYPHDFPRNVPLESSFASMKTKYDRRISRLFKHIEKGKDILIVYVCATKMEKQNDLPNDVLEKCLARINDRFPNKNIDLLYIFCDKNVCNEQIGDHIFKASFDYTEDGIPPYKLLNLRSFVESREYKLKQSVFDILRNLVFKVRKKIKKARAAKSSTK